ncbi:hypothetical protein [Enterobacter asburiae]|uniref:hypothetical protein n=1 Tax=Enterobacter asburiae TaxID=61645 RepID=UPI001E5FF3C0|nr:hypothetical protein [Enterobacter asburiae]MCE2004294.1 hypothetical protein [Enterobacter asburiae]
MYNYIKSHRHYPLNRMKIYNFTPDNLELKEILFPTPTHGHSLKHIWKKQPPAIIHSQESGSFELNGIYDIAAEGAAVDWNIGIDYKIGNTDQVFGISYYKDSEVRIGRRLTASLTLDDLMCDNGFYFMMFYDGSIEGHADDTPQDIEDDTNSLNGTSLIIQKIVRDKNLTFKAEHRVDDSPINPSEIIVNSHGQVEFISDILLKNNQNKTLIYLKKEVHYHHELYHQELVDSDTYRTETMLWEQDYRGLHCPDADPFDFMFPHKYTASGLTFRITATIIVDARSKKTKTHTFSVTSKKKHP